MIKYLGVVICLLAWPALADVLTVPTFQQRQEATALQQAGDMEGARAKLEEAVMAAFAEENTYVRSNELRYIGEMFYKMGDTKRASEVWEESMVAALASPHWNYALYGAIGVLEITQNNHAPDDTNTLAHMAVEAKLLERIAATGNPAETGRFFMAMDRALTEKEIESFRAYVTGMDASEDYKTKALHALGEIQPKS